MAWIPKSAPASRRVSANLEKWASNSDKTCHLASTVQSTEISLAPVMSNGNSRHISSSGLHVSLQNAEATLAVDTGASGLLVSRTIADRAGLKPAGRISLDGVGDQGAQAGYTAVVDSIRIGALEFRDCVVKVADRSDILATDGLIGTDVFSGYLVTLDYPMRKFLLSPLPPRPADISKTAPALSTEGGERAVGNAPSAQPQDRYIDSSMKDYFPVFRSGHFLIVPVVLNRKANKLFIVDTGAFSTSITPDVARTVTKVHAGSTGTVKGLSGDVNKVSFSEAITFEFAGIQQQNNDLYTFDASNVSKSAGMEIAGFLGSTLLRQLTISIDYRDGLVKFDYDSRHGNHNF